MCFRHIKWHRKTHTCLKIKFLIHRKLFKTKYFYRNINNEHFIYSNNLKKNSARNYQQSFLSPKCSLMFLQICFKKFRSVLKLSWLLHPGDKIVIFFNFWICLEHIFPFKPTACVFKANYLHMGPWLTWEVPSVVVFLRNSNMYLCKFRRKPRRTPKG